MSPEPPGPAEHLAAAPTGGAWVRIVSTAGGRPGPSAGVRGRGLAAAAVARTASGQRPDQPPVPQSVHQRRGGSGHWQPVLPAARLRSPDPHPPPPPRGARSAPKPGRGGSDDPRSGCAWGGAGAVQRPSQGLRHSGSRRAPGSAKELPQPGEPLHAPAADMAPLRHHPSGCRRAAPAGVRAESDRRRAAPPRRRRRRPGQG